MSESAQIDNLAIDSRYFPHIKNCIQAHYRNDQIGELIEDLKHSDILRQHRGAIGIRKLLANPQNPPIQDLIDTGIVPYLIELIKQFEYPQLQMEAAWTITNIASGTTEQCQVLVEGGVIPLMAGLLKVQNQKVVEQAVWAIGCIGGDNPVYRDRLIGAGAVEGIIRVIKKWPHRQFKSNSCWALSNLCRGNPLPSTDQVWPAIEYFCQSITKDELNQPATKTDCLWSVSYHTESTASSIFLAKKGLLRNIVSYINSNEGMSILVPSVRILGNASMGDDSLTDILIEEGILSAFQRLVKHEKKVVRREVCWVLSNIAAGTEQQVRALLNESELLKELTFMYQLDYHEIRRETGFIFANIVQKGDTAEVKKFYQENNIVKMFVGAIEQKNSENLRVKTMECLKAILGKDETKFDGFLTDRLAQTHAREVFVELGVDGSREAKELVHGIKDRLVGHPHFKDMLIVDLSEEGEEDDGSGSGEDD